MSRHPRLDSCRVMRLYIKIKYTGKWFYIQFGWHWIKVMKNTAWMSMSDQDSTHFKTTKRSGVPFLQVDKIIRRMGKTVKFKPWDPVRQVRPIVFLEWHSQYSGPLCLLNLFNPLIASCALGFWNKSASAQKMKITSNMMMSKLT